MLIFDMGDLAMISPTKISKHKLEFKLTTCLFHPSGNICVVLFNNISRAVVSDIIAGEIIVKSPYIYIYIYVYLHMCIYIYIHTYV